HAAVHRSEVELVRTAGDAAYRIDAPAAKRSEHAPPQTGVEAGVGPGDRDGGWRSRAERRGERREDNQRHEYASPPGKDEPSRFVICHLRAGAYLNAVADPPTDLSVLRMAT